MKQTILCVDDKQHNLDSLYRTLRKDYNVLTALNGKEGLELLECNDVALIITDQRMPEMTGVEFLEESLKIKADIQRIILTGFTEVDDLINAINSGRVYRYITKPWEPNELRLTVKLALQSLELTIENRRLFDDMIRLEKLATVGQVSSGIAHEVKNQLSVLAGVELIQNEFPDNDLVKQVVNQIIYARERIVNILNEIKRYSKESDPVLQLKEVRVSELLQLANDIMALDPDVKNTEVKIQVDQPQILMCDKDRVLQVLINFIRNAAHAMNGSGTILMEAKSIQDRVFISIRDSGCGISDEHIEKIWNPFFTTKQDQGTGLGLPICKKIIESHNGTVGVESEEGKGTTFTISLPIAD